MTAIVRWTTRQFLFLCHVTFTRHETLTRGRLTYLAIIDTCGVAVSCRCALIYRVTASTHRWSTRILNKLARDHSATPFLPFGGAPYAPFFSWALKTKRAWSSPVGMLVHDITGLMVSYRGALSLSGRLDLPATPKKPCSLCARPCLSTCPVNALSAEDGYNTDVCHAHLSTPAGKTCVSEGCLARRACPVSTGANRTIEQSAHHMSYFHRSSV